MTDRLEKLQRFMLALKESEGRLPPNSEQRRMLMDRIMELLHEEIDEKRHLRVLARKQVEEMRDLKGIINEARGL